MSAPDRQQVLVWIGRLGAVSSADVALRFGISGAAAEARLQALARLSLLERSRLLHRRPALWLATRAGLRAAGLGELEPCRVAAGGFAHLLACSAVGARFGAAGVPLSGERELRLWEREAARPLASAELGAAPRGARVLHRPDLVLWRGDAALALEVELSVKSPIRLRAIVRGWARSRCVEGVVYLCSPAAARAVRRAIAAEQATSGVSVLALEAWREEEVLAKFRTDRSVPSQAARSFEGGTE